MIVLSLNITANKQVYFIRNKSNLLPYAVIKVFFSQKLT